MKPIDLVISRLNGRFPLKPPKHTANGWQSPCPGHDGDGTPLSVTEADNGKVLLHCKSQNFSFQVICDALQLDPKDLFLNEHARPSTNNRTKSKRPFDNIHDAIAAYRFGLPSNIWKYHDAAGNLVGAVLRWDVGDNDKEVRPLRHDNGNWYLEGMSKPRPLYRLADIEGADLVAVTEGEKCADAARSIGLVATTPPHGSNSPHLADWSPLAGKSVWVFPDNDAAGEQYVDAVVRLLGKLDPMPTVRVVRLPDLDDGGDVFDFLERHDATEPDQLLEMITVVADAADAVDFDNLPDDKGQAKKTSSKPIVIGLDEERVADEVTEALCHRSDLFQRGGKLVHVVQQAKPPKRLRRERDAPRIRELPLPSLRELISTEVDFISVSELKTGEVVESHVRTPAWCLQAVHSRGHWIGIRPLEGVVHIPVLSPDGTLVQTPGYHEATGLLYEPNTTFSPIPAKLTKDDAAGARDQLLELVADFPFVSDAHKSAWLAGMLTPTARFAFDDPAPLLAVDANVAGVGKSMLTDVIAVVHTGIKMARSSAPRNDEEMRKIITSFVIAAEPIVMFDNISHAFGYASLEAALTGTHWSDRILSKNEVTPKIPLRTT